jgi:uncharacterized protein
MADSDPTPCEQHQGPVFTPVGLARPVIFAYAPVPAEGPPQFGDAGSRLRALAELAILFAVLLVAEVAGLWLAYALGVRDARWFNIFGTVAAGAVLLLAVVLMVRIGGRPLSTIGWRSDSPGLDIALGVSLTFFILASFVLATLLLAAYVPKAYEQMQKTPEAIQRVFPRMPIPLLLLMSAWVAVFEETLFRGFILTRLHAIVRCWPVVVPAGAVVFALPHFYEGPMAVGLIFVLGMGMGTVFVWRRSLLPVIVWHFVFNSVELVLLFHTAHAWK